MFGWQSLLGGQVGLLATAGSLGQNTLLDHTGGHPHGLDGAVGQKHPHALEVGIEPALGLGGHVRADTALLLGFTRTPDVTAAHGALT